MNRRACRALGALVAAGLLASVPAAAQEKKYAVLPFEGSQGFRHLLKLQGIQPLRSARQLAAVPAAEAVLIVLGGLSELDKVTEDVGSLADFRGQGGALLIATDRPGMGRLSSLGLAGGGAIEVTPTAKIANPELAYRGEESCPLVRVPAGDTHPVLQGLRRGIATNQPSSLRPDMNEGDLVPLLRFPPGCQQRFLLKDGFHFRGGPRPGGFFNAGNHWPPAPTFIYGSGPGAGRDRVLVLADRSVFMNGMLALPDTDNWAFARNCAQWFADEGQRKYALLIEDGRVMSNFDVPLIQMPLPPLKVVNNIVRGLENENFFNRLMLGSVPRARILHYLFLGASGLLLLYALSRLVRAHHHGETTVPLVSAHVAEQAGPELPLVARRTDAAVRAGNCYEAARDLARLCLEGADGEPPAAPPVVRAGGRRLRRAVERLWRLAYGATPTPVSPREFAGLAAMAARIRAALEDGTLRFENTNPASRGREPPVSGERAGGERETGGSRPRLADDSETRDP